MAKPIQYLTPGEIYAIAEDILGHRPNVRDRRLIQTAAARPILVVFGEEMFPSLSEKAAALLHALAAYHPFFDGNKRTAAHVTVRFLQMNGLRPTWTDAAFYAFVLSIAQKQLEIPVIAAWLDAHTEEV